MRLWFRRIMYNICKTSINIILITLNTYIDNDYKCSRFESKSLKDKFVKCMFKIWCSILKMLELFGLDLGIR